MYRYLYTYIVLSQVFIKLKHVMFQDHVISPWEWNRVIYRIPRSLRPRRT